MQLHFGSDCYIVDLIGNKLKPMWDPDTCTERKYDVNADPCTVRLKPYKGR